MSSMLDEIETRLEAARSGDSPMALEDLERIYTTGCAEVLELEADAIRIERRLTELRQQLRHMRTAIDWLQEEQAAAAEATQ